jgi:hypothetical protein
MSGLTFEQLRIPVALVLVIVAIFIFLPRGGTDEPAALAASPTPTIIVGEPGGALIATPSASPSAVPTPSPTPSPSPTPEPPDTFAAQVFACVSLSGSNCRGEFDELPQRIRSFTALVRFTDARPGDTINVILEGPGISRPGGPFTLEGGGDGYYYSTFSTGDLPEGEYTLTATRNGDEVARTGFRNGS